MGMEVSNRMQISEVLRPEDVLSDVSARSKTKLLALLSERAAPSLGVSKDEILGALQSRESLGSTGIGAGIAVPHAPVPGIDKPFALFVRLERPIDFEAIDDEPVDLVCLILTPPGEQAQYLKLLSSIARQLRSEEVVENIRSAVDSKQIHAMVTACDRRL